MHDDSSPRPPYTKRRQTLFQLLSRKGLMVHSLPQKLRPLYRATTIPSNAIPIQISHPHRHLTLTSSDTTSLATKKRTFPHQHPLTHVLFPTTIPIAYQPTSLSGTGTATADRDLSTPNPSSFSQTTTPNPTPDIDNQAHPPPTPTTYQHHTTFACPASPQTSPPPFILWQPRHFWKHNQLCSTTHNTLHNRKTKEDQRPDHLSERTPERRRCRSCPFPTKAYTPREEEEYTFLELLQPHFKSTDVRCLDTVSISSGPDNAS